MKLSDVPRTLIEIKDYPGGEDVPAHKAKRVFINGKEVLIEKNGITVDFGEDEPTVVTLRIMPTELRFNH